MDVLKMEALVLRIEPSCVIYVSAGNGEESVGGGGGYGEQRQQQQTQLCRTSNVISIPTINLI